MTTAPVLRIAALALAALLMLNAITDVTYLIAADLRTGRPISLYGWYAIPLVSALILGGLIFLYAKSIESDETPTISGDAILSAGLKLFGVYVITLSIPQLMSFIGLTFAAAFGGSEAIQPNQLVRPALLFIVYLGLGVFLMKRTRLLIGWIADDA